MTEEQTTPEINSRAFDIIIRNGTLIDGTGAPRFRSDIAIRGDRIAAIYLENDLHCQSLHQHESATIIDASSCMVTPGFVDMHSHADMTLPVNPTAESLVYQGITTAIVGQCGISLAPLLEESRQQVIAELGMEDLKIPWEEWSTFGCFLAYLKRLGTSVNVVPLVGQGVIRAGVMGFGAGQADAEQMTRMRSETIKAIDEGAIGISTGLIYPPGSYTSTEELIAFTRPVAERGGFYFSHIRGEGAKLIEAITEAIYIGRETGASVQISHFKSAGQENWYKAREALTLIDQANAEGLDITADMYPYLAGSTGLRALLPQWSQEGEKTTILERLAKKDVRRKIILDMQQADFLRISDWGQASVCYSPKNQSYEGRDIATLASEVGKSPHDWVFDALIETEMSIVIVVFLMSEDNRHRALGHPAMMIGTDGFGLAAEGPLSKGIHHPRSYGTFPRVLGHYVREKQVISLEQAIWKMCGLPAQKLRWKDRGLLKPGYKADIVVFDAKKVADCATYEAPHQYPVGIPHVIVNGELVIHHGSFTGARPGAFVR